MVRMDRTIVNITSLNNKKEYINKENKIEKKKSKFNLWLLKFTERGL